MPVLLITILALVGKPVVVTVKVPALPTLKVVLFTLVMVGAWLTARVSEAVRPAPPFVEVTALVVLFCVPALVPFTSTEKLQETLAASVASDRLTEDEPAVAVIVPPPHTPVRLLGVETTKPEGSVSVKPIPVSGIALALGLAIVKLRLVVPLSGILAAPKVLLMVGGATTSMLSEAVRPAPPFVEVTALVVLFCVPALVPFTSTEKLQEALAASFASDRLTEDEPAVAVIVPSPHAPVRLLGVETTKPEGNVSVKAIPLKDVAVFGFDKSKDSVVLPFSGMLAAPKDLLMIAGMVVPVLALARGMVSALHASANTTNSRTRYLLDMNILFIDTSK
jgi:hypothetical protein